jgi:peroxiredoxin
MKGFALLLALFASVANVAALSVGDAFPDLSIDQGFPPKVVSLKDRLAGKKTILVGLPGAFTPT